MKKDFKIPTLLLSCLMSFAQGRVLVYHETAEFRHSSIDNGINMITNLGEENDL